jgi:putative ABC transport system permease protein
MDGLELRLTARRLLQQPGYSLSVILLIALGVGAGTAVFTLVNALLLSTPASIAQAQRIVRLDVAPAGRIGAAAYPDYAYYRDNAKSFSALFAYDPVAYTVQVRASDRQDEAELRFVTGNFFGALRQRPVAGRLLNIDDDGEHAQNVLVIGEHFSERMFGSAAAAPGRTLAVSGHVFTIVGVVPAQFQGAARDDAPVELWLPMWKRLLINGRPRMDFERTPQYVHAFLVTMARLRDGVTTQAAQAELDLLAARLKQSYPDIEGVEVALSHQFGMSAPRRAAVMTRSRLLAGLAALVLAMVCANLANLALARALTRRPELIVKLALGAGRARLVRQFGLETLLLSALGGVLGLLCALWAARALAAFLPFDLARPPQPDLRVYVFALLLAMVSAFACGVAPMLLATRVASVHTASARTVGGGATTRSILVMVQVGLCFVLLTGAALFARTLVHVLNAPIGFDPNDVLVVQLNLQPHGYDHSTGALFYERALQRVRALPGVQSAALGGIVPFNGGRRTSSIEIEGRPVRPDQPLAIDNNVIGPGYFRTLNMALPSGRDFSAADHAGAPRVALINQSMAGRFWPNQNPLGKRFRQGAAPWTEVVGVVADTRTYDVTAPAVPTFYRAFAQSYFPRMQIYVRTRNDPLALADGIRHALAEIDPLVVIRGIDSLQQLYRTSIRSYTTNARLVTVLGALALLLSAIGLYAVTSYFVTQRRREFGLRLAIGAQPRDLQRDVLRGAAQRAGAGLIIGILGSITLVSLVERFLFELSPTDPATFVSAATLLLGSLLLATWWPARRAMRVEPVVALRDAGS